ncbi:hypothetical protein CoHVHLJ_057 [Columbid alphaherpesvirus 1]|uniref:Uncharacterized protein n=1 Tax=Columbid alphaherpesvirus 1 TaxID=93386 RepID=A0A1V0M8I4_9ALPH|nr:hypothetical protein CoHVHLJ_057 [Columbid alphaherpesvirus 1]ARD71368.1 hypothetical protein CoHVHLJ_057 [Columbid alphaherpesvirus 1]
MPEEIEMVDMNLDPPPAYQPPRRSIPERCRLFINTVRGPCTRGLRSQRKKCARCLFSLAFTYILVGGHVMSIVFAMSAVSIYGRVSVHLLVLFVAVAMGITFLLRFSAWFQSFLSCLCMKIHLVSSSTAAILITLLIGGLYKGPNTEIMRMSAVIFLASCAFFGALIVTDFFIYLGTGSDKMI